MASNIVLEGDAMCQMNPDPRLTRWTTCSFACTAEIQALKAKFGCCFETIYAPDLATSGANTLSAIYAICGIVDTCLTLGTTATPTATRRVLPAIPAARRQQSQGGFCAPSGLAPPLQQSFSVDFQTPVLTADVRPRSGMPGYVKGLPLLAGRSLQCSDDPKCTASPTTRLVEQFTAGLPIMGVGAACSGAAASAGAGASVVQFGVSSSSGCFRTLSLSQLKDLCLKQTASSASAAAPAAIPPELTLPPNLVVGIFGNADAYNVGEWLPVRVENVSASARWNESSSTCSGLVTELALEFVTAASGATVNPQQKTVFARARYISGSWSYSQVLAQTKYLDRPQRYTLKTSVRFEHMEQAESFEFIPPLPNLFPALSNDVFYPIRAFGAAAAVRPPVTMLVGASVLAVAVSAMRR
jgi:hypothetical protein